ncbi:carotenoid oxygenase [Cercophora scortea]|uniref:Carotenoid oxygenase n=1 Tax=Cercophora scortea TaxID=314031 RepID=A0AAE0M398_9PEZI|nr:carotenoid oxygenase [Cercophora scortea]
MATTKGNATGKPIIRHRADEEEDLEESLRNFRSAAYTEWPNEAGFDGLTEERGPIKLSVLGNIPAWACGSLYRTGPGVYKVEDTPIGTFYTTHWFDGLAHTHRFDIVPSEDGLVEVFYSSRRQADQMLDHIKKNGDRTYYSFGQRRDPCLGLFAKITSTWNAARTRMEDRWIENISVAVLPDFPGLDVAAGNIAERIAASTAPKPTARPAGPTEGGHQTRLPKNVWLSTDNSMMKQIDPRTLEPIGFATQRVLHPDLKGPMSCAHAQRDPLTGDVYNFNLELGRETTYRIFHINAATGLTSIIATIRRPDVKPAYIHSFYLSPSFVILCVPSSHIAMMGLRIMWERNVHDSIEPFDASKKCKWLVVDRLHGKGVVAEFETPAGFFFHTINAFEERDDDDMKDGTISLFCDIIEYSNLEVMSSLYYDVLLMKDGAEKKFWGNKQRTRDAMTHMARHHFRVHAPNAYRDSNAQNTPQLTSVLESASPVKLFDIPAPHSGELPTINPRFATKRHRYVYSLAYRGRSTVMDGIVKTDTLTREVLFWDNPHGHTPGEAIFVPRPEGTREDDGVLLSVVLDGHRQTSYLLCLDAITMQEAGRAEVGFAVAFGFHGVHVTS